MTHLGDYYRDTKFCLVCGEYVRYLTSLEDSHCVHCGKRVRLFSAGDMDTFRRKVRDDVRKRRPRPPHRGRETA